MDCAAEAKRLGQELKKVRDPAYAVGAKKYLKSDLEFIGARMPDLRRVAGAWLKRDKALVHDDLVAVTKALWRQPVFDLRILATVLLQRKANLLDAADLPWLESMLRDCRTWALLDNLAPTSVADVLARDPRLRRRALRSWANDDDFWMRRTALLAMHRDLARGQGDWPLWVALAEDQLEDQARWRRRHPSAEERFFIRKALGWALRDRCKSAPSDTIAFVQRNRGRLSGLTIREATRNLPAKQRAALGL